MRRIALLLCLLLSLSSCRKAEDPIAATIRAMEEAAEERDAGGVMEHLSAGYSGANGGRGEVERMLRQYFFGYKAFEVTITGLETSHTADEGSARFRAAFVGVPKELGGMDQYLPRAAVYRFQVSLVKEGSDWKVSAAHWEAESSQ
jgi:hypothetical protein